MLKTLPLYARSQTCSDEVLSRTRENLTGVRVIRAFQLQEQEMKNFDESSAKLKEANLHVASVSALINPLTYGIINLGIIALFYSGALQVNQGRLSSGQMLALYNYMSQILVELIKLASLVITISRSIACGNRIQQILDLETGPQSGKDSIDNGCSTAVEFRNVTLHYHIDSEAALEDISFKIPEGSTVGIIGSTGSGKTSTGPGLWPGCP